MSRTLRSLVVGLTVAGSISIGAFAGASALAQPAHVARSCGVGSGQGYGYSYLTSLTVLHTTCSVGRNVAHHHGRVTGWHCSKKRLASSPVQYDDRVSCSNGTKVVRWTFTQNT